LQHVFAAKAALIDTLSLFIGALLAYLCWQQQLSARQWLGLMIGFCGIIYATHVRWPGCLAIGITPADLIRRATGALRHMTNLCHAH